MGAPKTKKPAIETVADYVTGTLPGITLAAVAANLKVSELRPCGHNFRKDFDPAALAELAESIRTVGVLQPLVVLERRTGEFGSVTRQILCGERRWRAAQLAGVDSVPCMVHTGLTDLQVLEMVATENLARRDMNPHETLLAYQALRDAGLRPGEIAAKAGVAPAEVTKLLALERLPAEALELLRENDGKRLSVSAGYQIAQKWGAYPAAALALCKLASEGSLSVRQLEEKQLDYYTGQKLVDAGIARGLDWQLKEALGCEGCQHYQGRLCLAPAEYDRKVAERIAQAEKDAEERRQQLAARALPMAQPTGKKKGQKPEAAPEPQKAVLRIADLRYSEYQHLGKERPAGCDENCPCLASAVDSIGNSCDICLDPKRQQNLKTAVTRAENKATKEKAKAQIGEIVKLRCADPDNYADAPLNVWLEHEHREILAFALALRKLLGSCSVAGKRHAIAMLPTAEDLLRANETVKLDEDGNAIVADAYKEAAAGLREYFTPASTHANRDETWPGLLKGIGMCHPTLRSQILLAAVGAVCCEEQEEKIKNPGWYREEHSKFLLAPLPTTEALWRIQQLPTSPQKPEMQEEETPEEQPELIPLRVSQRIFQGVYDDAALMGLDGSSATVFSHGGSTYVAFPQWHPNTTGTPVRAKRVQDPDDAFELEIKSKRMDLADLVGPHVGMGVRDILTGIPWTIIDDTWYEVLDVTEVLPPAKHPTQTEIEQADQEEAEKRKEAKARVHAETMESRDRRNSLLQRIESGGEFSDDEIVEIGNDEYLFKCWQAMQTKAAEAVA